MKEFLGFLYMKIANHYFYKWINTKNDKFLNMYMNWVDKFHALYEE